MAAILAGQTLVVDRQGTKVDAGQYLADKVVALYFSASWCPPCQQFTPILKMFYEEMKAAGKEFEVVYISRDRTKDDLVAYYNEHHGAWTYLEFDNEKIEELITRYDVDTIPTLRVIKPDGRVVAQEARNEVAVASNGKDAFKLWTKWMSIYKALNGFM